MLLTRRGFQIHKSILTNEQLNKIKSDLFISPKIIPPFDENEEPIYLIHQTKDNIFIPKFYAYDNINNNVKSFLISKKINISFNGKLFDNQKLLIKDIIKGLNKYTGGIITLPCGYGKTVLALYLACLIKLKCIVLVHTEALKTQWIERIKEYVKNVKIGEIQQKTINLDADIIIGMIQTISKDKFKADFSDIGLLIVDECHHIGSREFSKCLYKINAEYTIGLSATPDRKDGLTRIINWYLGPQLIKIENKKNYQTVAFQLRYSTSNPLFNIEYMRYKGKNTVSTVKMISNICNIQERNEMIKNIIIKLLENPKRNIMILSGRVEHDKLLKELVDNKLKELNLNIKTYLYIGSCNDEERNDAINNAQVLFASYSLASEGLDIPRLNTVILASPQKDIKQSIGRIMRKIHDDNSNPLIIDINDTINPFKKYANQKIKLYNQSNYKYEIIDINEDLDNLDFLNQDNINKILCNCNKKDENNDNKIDKENEFIFI